jgi:cation diffusion facilitator family transporter
VINYSSLNSARAAGERFLFCGGSSKMIDFLIRKFIKNYECTDDPSVRGAYGKFASIVGIATNVLLSAIKIAAGALASSLSIISDGLNNLSDAQSSIISLIGFRLSEIPSDADHPYGHARFEYLASLLISMIIVLVGAFLLRSSVKTIIYPRELELTWLTFTILILSILLKLWQSRFYLRIGRKINSLALTASSADSRNDVISTAAVLAGAIIYRFTACNVDGWLSAAVAVFIIISGLKLAWETCSVLLGEAPSEELVKKIRSLITSYDGVLGVHDLIVHNYGPGRIFASAHVEVDADRNILESHDLIDNIEFAVRKKLGINISIHMDPICIHNPQVQEIRGMLGTLKERFPQIDNIHDLRIVSGPTHSNVVFDAVLVHGTPKDIKPAILQAAEELIRTKYSSYFVRINFDQDYTGK